MLKNELFFSSQSLVHKRLSSYKWNPGSRRGREDAFEKQIAVKWPIITLQEASDYVEHEILHERFHATHFAGCAILFNKDTFHPDISVKSIYLPRHEARCARSYCRRRTWRGFTRRTFTCLFSSYCSQCQKVFTVLSLHMRNIYAKKKVLPRKFRPFVPF